VKPIIEIENLTKIYRLGKLHGSYLTFRDAITQVFKINKNRQKKTVYQGSRQCKSMYSKR